MKNSKNRTIENIHVVAVGGFINQDSVPNKFLLPYATYMCDRWHLFDSIFPNPPPKMFGLIKHYL